MHRLIVIAILSTTMLISSLHADYGCTPYEDIQITFPTISIAHIDNPSTLENSEQLLNTISQMLHLSGYEQDPSKISIHKSQKNHIAIVETNKGKKFVKIKKRGEGEDNTPSASGNSTA